MKKILNRLLILFIIAFVAFIVFPIIAAIFIVFADYTEYLWMGVGAIVLFGLIIIMILK